MGSDRITKRERSLRLLRIVFCLPKLEWLNQIVRGEPAGAACIQQWYLAEGLRTRGHDLTLVAPHGQNIHTSRWNEPQVAPLTWSASSWFKLTSKTIWHVQQRLGVPYLNVFSNYRRFDACLRCFPGHDLVYERNSLYSIGVAKACKRLGLPYVLFFDADEVMEYDYRGIPITGILRWRVERLLKYNLKTADCVVCVSKPAKDNLVNNWSVPEDKILVFPNGVDVQRFQPDPASRLQVRTSLGMASNPIVMFVGGFYDWHDVPTLLEAFAQLLRKHPEVRLVLVGDGSGRKELMRRTVDLGIGDAVHFTGPASHRQLPRLLSAADVAVAPYPKMGRELWLSPMKLFEYMAGAKAVVASEIGQLAEVVEDGENGLLVPPGDSSALAAAVGRLIEDKSLLSRLGRQARKDAVRKYSWEQYLTRLERVYRNVIAGRAFSEA